jgi:Histidine phosphatase superfamily (branch 1)
MFRSLARRQPRARRSHRRSWTIPSGGSTICLPCSWKKFRRHRPNVLKDLTQVTVPDCQPLMLPLLRSAINGDSVSQGRGPYRTFETVVAVAHDSVNRALLMQLLDQPLSSYWRVAQAPCCVNEIDIVDSRVLLGASTRRVNHAAVPQLSNRGATDLTR